jgi:hypothetical protein
MELSMSNTPEHTPTRRSADLEVERVKGEALVFDRRTDHLHCLNPIAALVFDSCDGSKTTDEIREVVARSHPTVDAQLAVDAALEELADKQLIDDDQASRRASVTLSRRKLLAAMGLAVPFIATVLAPAPAQAASCTTTGHKCHPQKPCCGVCLPTGNCS